MALTGYIAALHDEDERHRARVRDLRQSIWNDTNLDTFERTIMGLTGSEAILAKYQTLATRIGEAVGEPIITVEEVKDGRVKRAVGGIVAGELEVVRWNYDPERRSGHAKLAVKAEPLVVEALHFSHTYRDELAFYSGEDTRQTDVPVGNIVNRQWDNRSNILDNDYTDTEQLPLIGRAEIYASELFQNGISDLLLKLDELAASRVVS